MKTTGSKESKIDFYQQSNLTMKVKNTQLEQINEDEHMPPVDTTFARVDTSFKSSGVGA